MNYSKDSRAHEEQKNKPKKARKKGKVMTFRIIIMVLIISLFAVVGGGLGVVIGIIKNTPDASTLVLKPTTNYTSFVYDAEGNQIDTFSTADNRIYATLDQIPYYLQKAVVSLEDERFYEHNGIDIKGIFRAVVKNIQTGSFSEGASTITQQLVKNNILSKEKKLTRKIQEQYLAVQFEKLYPKDTILEYYLNTIGLGQGVSGVQSAANRYFGKDVSELSLTESCVIAVITQYPTKYNPILNPENNWEKVKVCLDKMEAQGYISAAEHADALKENPYVNIKEVHKEFTEKSPHSYFVDAVLEQVVDDLQSELGYTTTQANNEVYGGGLRIYTTMDQRMQKIVDDALNDESLYPDSLYELSLDYSVTILKADGTTLTENATGTVDSESDIEAWKQQQLEAWGVTSADTIQRENLIKQPQPQAAFVLTDYRTGQVKALGGGRGDKTNRGFNYATQATRQPGSTFKVLAAYAPALDLGKLSPGSTLMDEPYTITPRGGKPYSPKNWDNQYIGPTSVRKAIYHSMNVLAVKTVAEVVGVDVAYDYLLNFGFSTLTDSDRVYALPLGGITKGVTALELNAAYSAIANDGTYIKPVFYTEVKDANGNVILSNIGENVAKNSHSVIKPATAHQLTDMMQDVVNIGTGTAVKNYFTSQPVAGKTGTTTDSVDLVFAGYTPYYSATIWTGYAQQKSLSRGGGSYHLNIWGKIMSQIHEGYEYKSFPTVNTETSDVNEYSICSASGKLATSLCYQDESHGVHTEYFSDNNAPKEYCDVHVEVDICSVSGKVATEYCPEDTRVKHVITRGVDNGMVIPDEYCDVHTAENTGVSEETPAEETPAEPLPPDNEPDLSLPEQPPSNEEEAAPPTTPSEPPVAEQPVAPPVVVEPVEPNPDDDNPFFIPQG